MKGSGAAKPGQRFSREMFYRNWQRACRALAIEGVDLYGGTRHSTATALSTLYSKDEVKDFGAMHGTNKALERYDQGQTKPSRDLYSKVSGLRSPDVSHPKRNRSK